MWHFLLVHITVNGGIGWSAQGIEEKGDLILFDEAAHLLHRLGRTVAIIERNKVDLAAANTALLIDHVPERGLKLSNHAIGRRWAAVSDGMTNLDLRRGYPGRVGRERGRNGRGQNRHRGKHTPGCEKVAAVHS